MELVSGQERRLDMSDFSKWLKRTAGVPEVNLRKNPVTGPVIAPVVDQFSADVLRALLRHADDDDLDLAEMLIASERGRRAREAKETRAK